jgi:Fe-S cluster biogenesis protein NfuA
MTQVDVFYEATPNPNSMKFIVTQPIAEQSVNFAKETGAMSSPLATKLFGFPWASEVYIGPSFVTVTKEDWVEWEILADPLSNLIKEHIENGEPVLVETAAGSAESVEDPNDPQIVRDIKKVLNTEIRPAVAMDGGDIVFAKYEENILYLHMQGACAGCPSSMVTLKQGIEARMQELFSEIKEVVSI